MLRNIFYDKKYSLIHQWTYDDVGESVYRKVFFKPYLYIPTPAGKSIDAYGIDGIPLLKREFGTEWERYEYLKTYNGPKYFNLPATQQFLLENYYTSDITDLTKIPLRIFYYDIEVIADEFPDPKDAKFPLTSITIFDTKRQKYFVWGIKRYDSYSCKDHLEDMEPEDIVYEYCQTEEILLKSFLRFWRANWPDLLVGYNSYSFDLPYIVHRIEKVLGEGKSSRLSPVDYIKGKETENKFGQTYIEYDIGGVSHLDYMILYKTFTPGERESDSLDYVCNSELGVGKIDHDGLTLQELAEENWSLFINYNIWDVKLMIMLEEKRRYLDVAKFSAFSGFCNIDKALGKVAIITGIIAKQGLLKNQIISTQTSGTYEKIPGGFVKEPDIGMYENVMVMDLNSLYPNTIITLNISPETKVGKVMNTSEDKIAVFLFKKNMMVDIPTARFREVLEAKNWALSAAGIIFDQRQKGLCAEFVDELYQKRKSVKKVMLSIETELVDTPNDSPDYARKKQLAARLDTEQYLYKILLNSTYGVLANRYFALYDLDCAKSITLTGQALIQESDKIANAFMASEWDLPVKDRVTGSDTDSAILSVDDILKKMNATMVDEKGDLTPEFVKIETKITDNLNNGVQEWAKRKWNTVDCRFEFKRESACTKALWVAKKHYIMYIRNSEGVKMDKLKYKGISVVKSTYSKDTKDIIKEIVQGIFKSNDRKEAENRFYDSYEKFFAMDEAAVATRSSIRVINKWKESTTGFVTGLNCPHHVKYALYYNHLLKKLNLEHKYPQIMEGQKIKLVSVEPNIYQIKGVAFVDTIPVEFGLSPNHSEMFEKCVIRSLEPIFRALKWSVPNPKKQYEFSLAELFS
jgi:DNA polymerase elongation subunit (family B)